LKHIVTGHSISRMGTLSLLFNKGIGNRKNDLLIKLNQTK